MQITAQIVVLIVDELTGRLTWSDLYTGCLTKIHTCSMVNSGFQCIPVFLDHNTHTVCTTPRLVYLNGDAAEWEHILLHTWRHHISGDERVFIDMVHPTPPTAEVEDHVAHLILSQHQTSAISILVAVEFLANEMPSVLTRFALRVSPDCTVDSLPGMIPVLDHVGGHRLSWSLPDSASTLRAISFRHGMCLLLT